MRLRSTTTRPQQHKRNDSASRMRNNWVPYRPRARRCRMQTYREDQRNGSVDDACSQMTVLVWGNTLCPPKSSQWLLTARLCIGLIPSKMRHSKMCHGTPTSRMVQARSSLGSCKQVRSQASFLALSSKSQAVSSLGSIRLQTHLHGSSGASAVLQPTGQESASHAPWH